MKNMNWKKLLIIISVSIIFTAILALIKELIGIDTKAMNYSLFTLDVIGCFLIFKVIFSKKKTKE